MKTTAIFLAALSGLILACGSHEQASQLATVTAGQVIGSFSSWFTTDSRSPFENAPNWAINSDYSFFPESNWAPSEDVHWSFSTKQTSISRGEISRTELQNISPAHEADWFRYLPVESLPAPIWASEAGLMSKGFLLIHNFGHLDEELNLAHQIYFKTFIRMKGPNQGRILSKIIVTCVGKSESSDPMGRLEVPKSIFMETIRTSNSNFEGLRSDNWKHFKSEVYVNSSDYRTWSQRCRELQGETNAYLDISVEKTGNGNTTAQFISTEMIVSSRGE
jgi:hypothetical protein